MAKRASSLADWHFIREDLEGRSRSSMVPDPIWKAVRADADFVRAMIAVSTRISDWEAMGPLPTQLLEQESDFLERLSYAQRDAYDELTRLKQDIQLISLCAHYQKGVEDGMKKAGDAAPRG